MAVTGTYLHPVAGVTPPTALQSSNAQSVVADVVATADADTTATITHNFGLSAAELASGDPRIILTPTLSQALTALSAWAVTTVATNSITLTKLTSTGSGNASAQLRVSIQRPHSITK
jgi:hypothetical protein